MATIGEANPTLVDLANMIDPDGGISTVAEILSQENEIIQDMPWMEGNQETGHKHTVRTGLPTPTWRKLYQGVAPTKGTTAQVTDTIGTLVARNHVDKKLVDIAPDKAKFRMNQAAAHLQGMSNEFASTLFYGNESSDEAEFTGLAPRFNDSSAANSDNLLLAGGAGADNCSVWLIGWGENTCTGIYPKHGQGGLRHDDLGIDDVDDDNGNPFRAYKDVFEWDCGLALPDWRHVVRVANIDVSNLTKNAASGADLIHQMIAATERVPGGASKYCFYMNRTVRQYLRMQVSNKSNVWLGLDEFAGKKMLHFDGIPIRRCDALTLTEATVS